MSMMRRLGVRADPRRSSKLRNVAAGRRHRDARTVREARATRSTITASSVGNAALALGRRARSRQQRCCERRGSKDVRGRAGQRAAHRHGEARRGGAAGHDDGARPRRRHLVEREVLTSFVERRRMVTFSRFRSAELLGVAARIAEAIELSLGPNSAPRRRPSAAACRRRPGFRRATPRTPNGAPRQARRSSTSWARTSRASSSSERTQSSWPAETRASRRPSSSCTTAR